MHPDSRALTASDAVAGRLKEARSRRGWTAKQLAEQCAAHGLPRLTHAVLNNIESGRPDAEGRRRRDISVDELLALAFILDVAPAHLLGIPEGARTAVAVVPGCKVSDNAELQQWVRGEQPLPGMDERRYFASALEQLPPRDGQQTTREFARSLLQQQAKTLLEGFNAETSRLAESTSARLEALVRQAEEAVSSGADPRDVIALLKNPERARDENA